MTTTNPTRNIRTRWAAIGAAIAISAGAGGIGLVSATSPAGASAFVPINPCRVADTRDNALFNTGPRSTPIAAEETHIITAWGDNGDCEDIPMTATGVELNVTPVGPTLDTYLTIWGDGSRPTASSLNPSPSMPPVPNSVTVDLTDVDGKFKIYNRYGSVNVVVDIVGYYSDHSHEDLEARLTALEMNGGGTDYGDRITDLETELAAAETKISDLETALEEKQDACSPGSVAAFVNIAGFGAPSALTDADNGYNCTDGYIKYRRVSAGVYEVEFENLPTESTTNGLVVHITATGGSGGNIVGHGTTAGDRVRVNIYDHQGNETDSAFALTLIYPGDSAPS